MQHGELVEVSRSGIRIPEAVMQPIGISDDSLCWGLLLPRSADAAAANPGGGNTPHMVISSIPPNCWPKCYRAEIIIHDDAHTLAHAAEQTTKLDINIVCALCAPSGFRHATWIAQLERLSDWPEFQDLENKLRSKPNISLSSDSVRSFAASALDYGYSTLQTRLSELLKEAGVLYVPDTKVTLVHDDLEVASQEYRNLHAPRSVRVTWNRLLARHWIRSRKNPIPTTFRYSRSKEMLVPNDLEQFAEIIENNIGLHFPFSTSASFDRREHFLRLTMSRDDRAAHKFKLDCNYGTPSRIEDPTVGSKGLLASVLRLIRESGARNDVKLVNVSNVLTDRSTYSDGTLSEAGKVSIIGEYDERLTDDRIRDAAETLKESVSGAGTDNAVVSGVSVRTVCDRMIFLSTRFHYWKRAEFASRWDLLEDIASEYGFAIRTADSRDGREQDQYLVLREAMSLIDQSSASLAMLPRREELVSEEDMQWPLVEYGAATYRSMDHERRNLTPYPVKVCVFTRRPDDLPEWQRLLKINPGQSLIEIPMECDNEWFGRKVREAVSYLSTASVAPAKDTH